MQGGPTNARSSGPQCGSVLPQHWHHIRANQVACSPSVPSSTSPPALNEGADVNPRASKETGSYWPIDSRVKYSPIKLKGVRQISQSACKRNQMLKSPLEEINVSDLDCISVSGLSCCQVEEL